MTDDFERILRDDIARAGDNVNVRVDLDAVIDAGGRAVRQQRMRRTAGLGSLAAVALVASLALPPLVGRQSPAPAVPSVVPTVSHSPSPVPPRAVMMEAPFTSAPTPPERFKVETVTSDPTGRIELRVTPVDGKGQKKGTSVPLVIEQGQYVGRTTRGSLGVGTAIVAVRGGLTELDEIRQDTPADWAIIQNGTVGHQELSGVGLRLLAEQAFGSDYKEPTGRVLAGITGFRWRDLGGVWHTDRGTVLPSATTAIAGDQIAVVHDLVHREVVLKVNSNTHTLGSSRKQEPEDIAAVTLITGDEKTELGYFIAVVPRSWRLGKASCGFTGQKAVQEQKAVPFSDGEILVVCRTQAPKGTKYVDPSFTFIDGNARGHVVTVD